MKKLCLLLLLLLLPALGQAEALPVLRLDTPVLDYVAVKPGRLTLGDFVTPVTAKYRGSYSVTFTGKRNYALHIKDEAGEQRKVSLLGLREDDDYVLLGALSDPSRLRSVIGLELWVGMDPENTFSSMRMVLSNFAAFSMWQVGSTYLERSEGQQEMLQITTAKNAEIIFM